MTPASLQPLTPGVALAVGCGGRTLVNGAQPLLQITLHLKLTDDQPGDDGHQQPQHQIQGRYLPAEQGQ